MVDSRSRWCECWNQETMKDESCWTAIKLGDGVGSQSPARESMFLSSAEKWVEKSVNGTQGGILWINSWWLTLSGMGLMTVGGGVGTELPSIPLQTHQCRHSCVYTRSQLMCRTQLAEPGQAVYCPTPLPKAIAPSEAGVLYLGDFWGDSCVSEFVCQTGLTSFEKQVYKFAWGILWIIPKTNYCDLFSKIDRRPRGWNSLQKK